MIHDNADYGNGDGDDFLVVHEREGFADCGRTFHVRFDDILTVGGTARRDNAVAVTIRGRAPERSIGHYVSRDELNKVAADRDARRKAQAERDKFLLQMTKRTVVAQERQAKLAEKQSRSKTLELLGFKMAAAAALMGGRAGK